MAGELWRDVAPRRPSSDVPAWIQATYGDLRLPDFRLISQRLTGGFYAPVEAELVVLGKVTDGTSEDDDVARCLIVHAPSESWCVWLSCVGPFCTGYRAVLGDHTELLRSDFVTSAGQRSSLVGAGITVILATAGLRILTPDELDEPIAFDPLGETGPVPLWRVLFSDHELW